MPKTHKRFYTETEQARLARMYQTEKEASPSSGWWTLSKRVRNKLAGTDLAGASYTSILQYGDERAFKKLYPKRGNGLGRKARNGAVAVAKKPLIRRARRHRKNKRVYTRRSAIERFVLLGNGMSSVTVTVSDGKKAIGKVFFGAKIGDISVNVRHGTTAIVKI